MAQHLEPFRKNWPVRRRWRVILESKVLYIHQFRERKSSEIGQTRSNVAQVALDQQSGAARSE